MHALLELQASSIKTHTYLATTSPPRLLLHDPNFNNAFKCESFRTITYPIQPSSHPIIQFSPAQAHPLLPPNPTQIIRYTSSITSAKRRKMHKVQSSRFSSFSVFLLIIPSHLICD